MKPRVLFIIITSVAVVATIIAYQAISSSKAKSLNSSSSTSPNVQYTPSTLPSSPTVSGGEEVNQQGQRRPPQYLHICDTADGIEYVSQGTPKCLGSDAYQTDYDPSVAGTVFSSPCRTTSGTLRYVYISNDETCPSGTKLLFYNSLGGSTSGPSSSSTPSTTTTN